MLGTPSARCLSPRGFPSPGKTTSKARLLRGTGESEVVVGNAVLKRFFSVCCITARHSRASGILVWSVEITYNSYKNHGLKANAG